MDLEQQLRAYLDSRPDSIVIPSRIRSVLKDFECPEREQDILVHLIHCGLGTVLNEKPDRLNSILIRNTVQEMEQRFGTSEKYTLEGLRFWTKVYGIQMDDTDFLTEADRADIQAEEPEPEVSQPKEKENKGKKNGPQEKIGKNSGFLKFSELRFWHKVLFIFGVFLCVYQMYCARSYFACSLGFMFFLSYIPIGLGLLHILKGGHLLPLKNGSPDACAFFVGLGYALVSLCLLFSDHYIVMVTDGNMVFATILILVYSMALI